MLYLLLIAGLVLLLFAGDLLIRGAVGLAQHLSIPPLIIGLTIVAFGTSAPELVVSIESALWGHPGIAVGNVVGSNIANILLVLGLPSMIYPIMCNQDSIRRNTLFMVGVSMLFIGLCYTGSLGFFDGALLFSLVVLFLGYAWYRARVGKVPIEQVSELEDIAAIPHDTLRISAFLVLGLIGLPLGAHLTVEGASGVARIWEVPEGIIGLSVVAFGTSLPELVTTMAAAIRRNADIGIGNVIGSNIFNVLAIMGITAMVTPVPVAEEFLRFDLWVMLLASLLIVPFAMFKGHIGRVTGAMFFTAYLVYIVSLFH